MGAAVAIGAAVLAGAGAAALTPRLRTLTSRPTDRPGRWPNSGAHVLLAALLGAGGALVASSWTEAVTFAVAAVLLALAVVADLAVHRLPNPLTWGLAVVLVLGLGTSALLAGTHGRFLTAALAGAATPAVLLVLHLLVRGGLGRGDVKLGVGLGLVLGWWGWQAVWFGLAGAFVLSGVGALALIATRRATLKTRMAFGPWLVAGAVASLWVVTRAGGAP